MPFESDTASSLTDSATATPVDPDTAWRDRLVELHVLAEHGDTAAAGEAQTWIASDERAHRAWHEIEDTCHRLRGV